MSLQAQAHYDGRQCLDAIADTLGKDGAAKACLFNAIKYWWRIGRKGPAEVDAEKAHTYLVWCLEFRGGLFSGDDAKALILLMDKINEHTKKGLSAEAMKITAKTTKLLAGKTAEKLFGGHNGK